MGLFDKVGAFIKREAEDIGEVAERARDRLDEELTEREEELEMTPSEKLRALQRKGRETDDRFDEIIDKAEARASQVEAEAEVAAVPVDLGEDAPNVTHIVLPDGSVRSGDDPPEPEPGEDDEADGTPEAGDLSWVAPQAGEEAVVPAFQGRVATAEDSASSTSDQADPASGEIEPISEPMVDPFPDAPQAPAPPIETPAETFQTASSPDVLAPGLDDLPPPPAAPIEAAAPVTPAAPVEDLAVHTAEPTPDPGDASETPSEIAARVVADLDVAEPAPAADAATESAELAPAAVATEPVPPAAPPEPVFDKTPAQIKYEQAREAADALLDELRGELKADGEI